MTSDFINGLFEMGGSFVLWRNAWATYQDKKVRGVRPSYLVFFGGWGLWNLFYYPHLDQWWSFYGGVNLVVANAVWLGLMMYYNILEHPCNGGCRRFTWGSRGR